MTLTEFLLARIAEDEAAARACVYPPHDGYKPHPELSRWFYREGGEVEYVQTPEMLAHKYPERLYVTCDGEGLTPAVGEVHGEHIARHDPARVLAECEAKRRIVAEAFEVAATIDGEWGCCHDAEDIRRGYREPTLGWGDEAEPLPEGCAGPEVAGKFLQALAAVYAGHEDYRQEWKP